jgi:hypothetical protein
MNRPRWLRLHQVGVLFTIFMILLAEGWSQAATERERESAALKDFSTRVNEYVKLHKQQDASLPALKQTNNSAEIQVHQRALAEKIKEARSGGSHEIFSPEISALFRHRIERHFKSSPTAPQAKATIRLEEPVKVHLKVNDSYPADLPLTTMPPTLLQQLPPLPQQLEYRIVGRDLVLLDLKANLIVDVIRQALPEI